MRTSSGLMVLAAMSVGGISPGRASATPAQSRIESAGSSSPDRSEVSIPSTRKLDFISKVNGHAYAIKVALPFEPAPAKGYRVIYVFDGDGYFGTVTEAVRANGNAPGTVVVGIGYPDTPAFIAGVIARHGPTPPMLASASPFIAAVSRERQYDMTLPGSDAELADYAFPGMPAQKSTEVGGMADFLKMIEVDIKPRVEAMTKIDRGEQTLFGHSLGGLAVLAALFSEPEAYRNFVAASPSIWWNHEVLLKQEAAFAARVKAGTARPRVLITMGSREQEAPDLPPEMAAMKDRIQALVASSRMVDNGRELTARLQALHGRPPYKVADYAVFADQDHGISTWPAIGRAVAFAVQP